MRDYGPQATSELDTTYSISGFRSLKNFEITLRPGINVLVGPNGSGKTNFIEFLDFLDHVLRHGAATAVSSAGGVARVFSIEDAKKASPSVVARVRSIAEMFDMDGDRHVRQIFNFEYEIEIKFSRANSAIFIAREFLKIRKARSSSEDHLANSLVGNISVNRKTPNDDNKPKWTIGPRLLAESGRNPLSLNLKYTSGRTAKDLIERFVVGVSPDESFLSPRSLIPAIDAVRSALTRGRSINIIPARAREPDDLTKPPIIQRDGSGLSATLHNLQVAQKGVPSRRRNIVRRRAPIDGLDMVIAWTKLVFPELQDILVVQDPHTGKYLVYLVVGEESPLRISLQAASDGTVKWLAFVCLVISSGLLYSIEEPENYLHPKMQQFLVQLIRENTNRADEDYVIFSTHSETLINQCQPEELIIFRFNGGTTCHRISNPDDVREEINKTGFGLGYYYASNAIS